MVEKIIQKYHVKFSMNNFNLVKDLVNETRKELLERMYKDRTITKKELEVYK